MKTIFFIWNSSESQKSHQSLINDLFYYGYDMKFISIFMRDDSLIKEIASDQNCFMVFTENHIEAKNRKLRWLPNDINAIDIIEEINQEYLVVLN